MASPPFGNAAIDQSRRELRATGMFAPPTCVLGVVSFGAAHRACCSVLASCLTALGVPSLAGAEGPSHAPVGGAVGTPARIDVIAASAYGHWVVIRQTRGPTDEGYVYLVDGAGPGRRIDEYLAADPEGRWLLLRERGRVVLLDMQTGSSRALHASTDDVYACGAVNGKRAFFTSGGRLVYASRRAGGERIVVRELELGAEHTLNTPGTLSAFEALGTDWIRVWSQPDGPEGPSSRLSCAESFASLSNGNVVKRDGVIGSLGSRLLIADLDGGFSLLDRGGVRSPLVPASCHAVPVRADDTREEILVACRRGSENACGQLMLFSPAHPPRPLGQVLRVARTHPKHLMRDVLHTSNARFVAIGPCTLLDLRTGKVLRVEHPSGWVAGAGPHIALIEDGKLLLRNVDDGREQVLRAREPRDFIQLGPSAGTTHVLSGLVIDLKNGRKLGTSIEEPQAVTLDGRVLAWEPGLQNVLSADFEARYGRGPLRWYLPVPAQ